MNGSKTFTTFGHVDDQGKLQIYNQDDLRAKLQGPLLRTSVELRIRERQWPFSEAMRKYYFAVIVKEIQKAWRAAGEIKSLEEVDTDLRLKFLYKETRDPETDTWIREPHTLRKGETEVTKKMMREFCDLCIIWAVQALDWPVPYPGEQLSREEDPNHSYKSNISL